MTPGTLDLFADRRVAFLASLVFEGADLTGAQFASEVRRYPDQPGSPLVSLATVSSGAAEGWRLISVETVEGQPRSTVGLRINETTIEGLPLSSPLGGETVLAWDLHVTALGTPKQKYLGGRFVVRPGVTL